MLFSEFALWCERIEQLSGRLEMIDLIAGVLPDLDEEDLPIFVRFIRGLIFPDWSPANLGIGPNLLYDAVAYVGGKKRQDIVMLVNQTGDAGRAVELFLLREKTQQARLFPGDELTLAEVYTTFERMADTGGLKSQREKQRNIQLLFSDASPLDGRYLTRLMLEELRIGVGEGNVRDAIARAFGVSPALVDRAHQVINDLGEVARIAKSDPDALEKVTIELFRPVKVMLAQAGTIQDMITGSREVAAEYKYDGSRFQFHRSDERTVIYSRRLEDLTDALPDVAEKLHAVCSGDLILDGEVIAIKDGHPMPFQTVLRRIRRKHDVAGHVGEIEMIPLVFDILYKDGRSLIDLPLSERRLILEESLTGSVAPQIRSSDEEELLAFYHAALDEGHEGIMLKGPASPYIPGNRGKHWIKCKPEVETMDLAVIGGEWGEGRRARHFGSFLLACRDDQDNLLPVSRVATGINDETLGILYDLFKDRVISESGKEVTFEPGIIFEIGYSEIQKSPNYASGYALRFPRFVRIRDDKRMDEIESLASITGRYHPAGPRQTEENPHRKNTLI
ncbi:DNA ligase-1 [Methanocalculus alkaliphilus]|uniref:ATP-dependent DNA ligase n=1 Tax=Methanocalculus alkaliphilus TaxID=768730 RepID=UPI00209F0BA5|nr:ATP-dependent DNA ligase [Methanocalculus alkaliphilus]MCP1714935.1 DNA ligase-1 [Methanocalculus alkaliphilus]